MRVEGGLARKSSGERLVAGKSNPPLKKGKRRQGRQEWMPTMVQRLFDTCKEVFADCKAGFVPPPDDVARIKSILNNMKPADVGVSPKLPYFRNTETSGPPPIAYLHVYECPNFSIGIFCLPPSAVLPLHNHPGMTVFSKLLFGTMHIKSYDWVVAQDSIEPSQLALSSGERLAKVNTDAVFTAPCETSILYPASGGNMHCFTAKSACVVLDVLGPPYSIPERNCIYYYDYDYPIYAVGAISTDSPSTLFNFFSDGAASSTSTIVGTISAATTAAEVLCTEAAYEATSWLGICWVNLLKIFVFFFISIVTEKKEREKFVDRRSFFFFLRTQFLSSEWTVKGRQA